MAISKIILNGVTQMDLTGKTVTASSMRSGVTALKNDGTDVTGNIPDMTLPSAASSTSSGTAKATITPTSSAQYLNIPAGYLETAQFYTIAAASGGASNIVTGTFKGTTTGAAMDVNIPYTGSGYPIVVLIFPKEGPYNSSTGSWYSLIQRYAIGIFLIVKDNVSSTPDYTNNNSDNSGSYFAYHKNSTTSATSYSAGSGSSARMYQDTSSAGTRNSAVRVKSATKLSVYIASTSYGFAANIEYTYLIIYSS